jgi:hypothetical protein
MPIKVSALPLADALESDDLIYAVVDGDSRRATVGQILSSADPFLLKVIGEPFALWDHITGCPVPDNSGDAKFIKLTSGLTGAGGFNEGLLGSESVTGTAPLVEATATILVGPMTGQTVHLINTEEAFLRARATSGALQMDQMQRITGQTGPYLRGTTSGIGSLTTINTGTLDLGGATTRNFGDVSFNSADSPNARVSSTTDGETRSKNVSATYYLRIF